MADVPIPKEKWSGKIGTVTLGTATPKNGELKVSLRVGGESGMPFLSYEGLGYKQLVAGEVLDSIVDIGTLAIADFGNSVNDPSTWAKEWVERYNAEMIVLKLISTNPDGQNTSPEDAARTVLKVLSAVSVPLIVYGCGNEEKDAKTLEAISNACSKDRLALGHAEENAYKSVSAAAMANHHAVVAFSNLDINLAKQMNILLADFGVRSDDILMDPLMASLGMGLEYSYSVNERIRMAALMGDKMLQSPIICDATPSLEAREVMDDVPEYGDKTERATWWETTTALAALMSGADIVIVRSPRSLALLKDAISSLRGE